MHYLAYCDPAHNAFQKWLGCNPAQIRQSLLYYMVGLLILAAITAPIWLRIYRCARWPQCPVCQGRGGGSYERQPTAWETRVPHGFATPGKLVTEYTKCYFCSGRGRVRPSRLEQPRTRARRV